jgi:hypothetical protein
LRDRFLAAEGEEQILHRHAGLALDALEGARGHVRRDHAALGVQKRVVGGGRLDIEYVGAVAGQAATSAVWTNSPRPQLMSMASGFISAMVRALIISRVSGVRLVCRVTMSEARSSSGRLAARRTSCAAANFSSQ